MIRLRQIAMVVRDLDRVVARLQSVFGLDIAHVDPGVEVFGLENRVLPVGTQFLEVLAPIRPGTAAERYMARRGGDTGYMVICQCDDQEAVRARIRELGLRVAWERDQEGYSILQLHPKDTGGTFLEIDWAAGWEQADGPWPPAGEAWREHVRTEVVRGIIGAEIESPEPQTLASRWSAIMGLPAEPLSDGSFGISLENARLRFVASADGRSEGLRGVELDAVDPTRALRQAEELGLPAEGETIVLGGMRFRLRGS